MSDQSVRLEDLARNTEAKRGGFVGFIFAGAGAGLIANTLSHSTLNVTQLVMGSILLTIGIAMMGIAYSRYQSNKPKEIPDSGAEKNKDKNDNNEEEETDISPDSDNLIGSDSSFHQ